MGKYDNRIIRLNELLNQSIKVRKEINEELSSLFFNFEEEFKVTGKNPISTVVKAVKDGAAEPSIFQIKDEKNIAIAEMEDYLWGWLGTTAGQAAKMDEEALTKFIYVLNIMNKV